MKTKPISFGELRDQTSLLIGKTVEKMLNANAFILYLEIGALKNVELVTPGGKKYSSEDGD